MIPTSQPNAAQKRWMKAVRSLGSVISGGPAVIHHAVGRTARHNKIQIGHEWLIPLTDDEHKRLHRGERPWLDNREFSECETRKAFEKLAIRIVCQLLTPDIPAPEVCRAISGYHR